MKQFEVQLKNIPGELARLTSSLARVNIRSLHADKAGNGDSVVRFMTIDEEGTRHALNGYNFIETEVLLLNLPDRPGELAKLTKTLGEEQINIDTLNLIDRSLFALQVSEDDLERARAVLKEHLIDA